MLITIWQDRMGNVMASPVSVAWRNRIKRHLRQWVGKPVPESYIPGEGCSEYKHMIYIGMIYDADRDCWGCHS